MLLLIFQRLLLVLDGIGKILKRFDAQEARLDQLSKQLADLLTLEADNAAILRDIQTTLSTIPAEVLDAEVGPVVEQPQTLTQT